MRAFSALCFVSLQLGVFWTTAFQVVVAQPVPFPEQSSGQSPAFSSPTDVAPGAFNNEVSPQLNRYLLGTGDTISVVVQRPPGPYRLGTGDTISVVVQRFPDLSFQAVINPEGNIIVPLIKTVSLQGLTLEQAQEKIRLLLNRYVVEPIVVLSLAGQRPDLSFQAVINAEGNILVPLVGTLSLQGLNVEEAQEKIRLALSRVLVDPIVVSSVSSPRPLQVSISGEVFRP